MRVETNEWRPYGKIIYQKQNFIVKQVAMLRLNTMRLLAMPAARFSPGSIRIYISCLTTGANSLPRHPEMASASAFPVSVIRMT